MRGVVSHESALVFHGLSHVNPSRVHLTVPRDNYPRGAGGELYRLHRGMMSRYESSPTNLRAPIPFDVPGQVVDPYRFAAKISYQGKPFSSVPIEISAVEAGNAENFDTVSSDALTLVGIPASDAVPCMTLPCQIAQKIHASTEPVEPHRTNDRAHDLVDLQLLEALVMNEPLAETRAAAVDVFVARSKHTWPPKVVPQPHWGPIYLRAVEGLDHIGLAASVVEAADRAQEFVDRIDMSNK